jgi:hypothetical protein
LQAQRVAIRSGAHAVDVGFPEKHRACPWPDVMPRSASVYTDTTLIAARARDATATGSAPTVPTTATNAEQALARDAKPISDFGRARFNLLLLPKDFER